jgi:DNA-binding transcriptional regulator GbsR (MarR family)
MAGGQSPGRLTNAPPGVVTPSALDNHVNLSDNSVMTEMTTGSAPLPPAVETFVLRWGDMGGQWGVNRSVAQIHALLYLSEKPLTAEDIAETLTMARSNVSNSLKELLGWKLIYRSPMMGDRRDHYAAETDLWRIATRIAQGRKEREIDPMMAALGEVEAQLEADGATVSAVVRARISAMHDFASAMDNWYGQMIAIPPQTLMTLIRMGAKVVDLLRFVGGRGAPG